MRTLNLILACVVFLAGCGGGGGGSSNTNPPVTPPPSGNTDIFDVQGSGATSPLDGQTVTVEGTVTGDFQDNDADDRRNLRGFYIQGTPDGNTDTSDGISVFDGTNPAVDVNVGDSVEVEGTVNEYFGETQIEATSVTNARTFALSVQWHPEYWSGSDAPSTKLFNAFGEACRAYRAGASHAA